MQGSGELPTIICNVTVAAFCAERRAHVDNSLSPPSVARATSRARSLLFSLDVPTPYARSGHAPTAARALSTNRPSNQFNLGLEEQHPKVLSVRIGELRNEKETRESWAGKRHLTGHAKSTWRCQFPA